jgi:activator of HSP90 ATPase
MKDYSEYFIIPEIPEIVYQALVTAKTIRMWTGLPAVMEPVEGSEFELYDASLVGINLELIPHQKIVQQWFFGDQEEDSIVTLKFFPHKKGTSLQVIHTNIPDEAYEEIVSGWRDVYMADLIDFYKE